MPTAKPACSYCFEQDRPKALAIIFIRWPLTTTLFTLHSHGVRTKWRISLPLKLIVNFIPILKDLLKSGHIVLFVKNEIFNFCLKNWGLPSDLASHLRRHLFQTLVKTNICRLIVVEIIFFCQRLKNLESWRDVRVVFGKNVIGAKKTVDLLAKFFILNVDLCEKRSSVIDQTVTTAYRRNNKRVISKHYLPDELGFAGLLETFYFFLQVIFLSVETKTA